MPVDFILNGAKRTIDPVPGESLLDALRERCNTTSVKDGCQPQGQCGCCLALVDGQPKVSCLVGAEKVAGEEGATPQRVAGEGGGENAERTGAAGGAAGGG